MLVGVQFLFSCKARASCWVHNFGRNVKPAPTTPHRHYHKTVIDDESEYYDDDTDHNGFGPEERGRRRGGKSHAGLRREHRRRDDDHLHRPWFLRGSAGTNLSGMLTRLLSGVVSAMACLVWT